MPHRLSQTFNQLGFLANIAFNKVVQILSKALPRDQETVVLNQGTLKGLKYTTRIAKTPYIGFLGVPYAKPPVNDLRFKAPVEHPGWSGELKAFSEGNKCIQYVIMKNIITGSEDCLYLNVFVPQVPEESSEKKAVMIFIHGGSFQYGSATLDEYTPEYLIDENVIVVTFNYRLNVFGFLNFDVDDCPGNMGLKDQLLAIKWTKSNISAFGGDPDNITIFGESAGSASVHYQTLSPQSTGLFKRAIMQSGCAFNHWALVENHKEIALELGKNLGCQKEDPQEIVQYLRTLPANDILKMSKIESLTEYLVYKFLPSVECEAVSDRFLPDCPENLAKIASPIPVITGLNNKEGFIVTADYLDNKKKQLANFHKIDEMIRFFKGQYSEEDVKKISNFYFNECNLECETSKLHKIIDFYTDFFFIKDFHRGFDHLYQQDTTPTYVYEFKFDGDINVIKNIVSVKRPKLKKLIKGACHGDELCCFFYAQLLGFLPKPDSQELKMCRTMSKLWSNFAKTGNPNSPDLSFEWRNTSAKNPKYLSIDGDDTKMVDELLYESKMKFWQQF